MKCGGEDADGDADEDGNKIMQAVSENSNRVHSDDTNVAVCNGMSGCTHTYKLGRQVD